MSGNYGIVKYCESLPVNECDLHDHCKYTFDKAPSTVAGTCTHKAKFRNDWRAVELC